MIVETMEALVENLWIIEFNRIICTSLDRVHGTSHFEVPRTVGLN